MIDDQQLQQALIERDRASLYRRRRTLHSAQQPELIIDGRPVLAFCSNDYLGLANDARVKSAFMAAVQQYGVGGGASHLVCGHSAPHQALEEELAQFTGCERALLFSCGYMANLGVLTALLGEGDAVFEDRLNHASLLDGGRFSAARFRRYPHAQLDTLKPWLANAQARRKLVVTDGVFSMDGDVAPLPQLLQMCQAQGASLMVDDAHGFGVLGAQGGGCVEAYGLPPGQVAILVGTLGKAFGTAGAFVAGSEALIETLIQQARTYIYTTSLPPAVAAATRVSLRLLQEEHWRRERLQTLIREFRCGCDALGLSLLPSSTPIQPLLLNSAERALRYSQALEAEGIYVSAIRPPTVPEGYSRLRITLTAAHTSTQVARLLDALARVKTREGEA